MKCIEGDNIIDDRGKQGLWLMTYLNGRVASVIRYKDNSLNGIGIWYNSSGEITHYGNFRMDLPIGYFYDNRKEKTIKEYYLR